jgi:hypothetical protein
MATRIFKKNVLVIFVISISVHILLLRKKKT